MAAPDPLRARRGRAARPRTNSRIAAGCGSWMTMKSHSPSSCERVVERRARGRCAPCCVFHSTSAPCSALCTVLVTPKNSSLPWMTCHSASRPTSRVSGTWVARSSATPPPYAVALMCSTRAPWSGFGELADALDACRARRRPRSRRGACRAGEHVRARRYLSDRAMRREAGRAVNLLHVPTCRCVSRQVPRNAQSAAEAATAMAAGLGPGRVRRRRRKLPLADGGEGTLDALLAARGGSRAHGPRHRSARRSGRRAVGRAARRPSRSIEMARASGLALVGAAQRSAARDDAWHRRADRGRAPRRIQAGDRRRGRERDDRRRARRGRRAGLVVAGNRSHGRVRRHDAVRRRGAACTDRRRARRGAQVALLDAAARAGLPKQYAARTGVDVTGVEGGGAAGGLAGGLAAIGARLVPGFDVVAEARRPRSCARRARDIAVTGEGRLDATSLEGKVVGGVLDWCEESRRPERRR